MADVPAEDPATYDMICRADTVGVFQIESRAQMAMLPRLKPAMLLRPGDRGGHRPARADPGRHGAPLSAPAAWELEPVTYPSEAVRGVLERTLGVPIFQEQVMQLAVVAAGFTPGEADRLRRSMAAWRRRGGLEGFEERLISGMRERGYAEDFARAIYQQILGFGEYGFPESHAASFALLVYVSAWLKRHEPAAFTCALLNSQPMGFYAPAQLVQDARRHGIEVRPVYRGGQPLGLHAGAGQKACQPSEQPPLRLGLQAGQGPEQGGGGSADRRQSRRTLQSTWRIWPGGPGWISGT